MPRGAEQLALSSWHLAPSLTTKSQAPNPGAKCGSWPKHPNLFSTERSSLRCGATCILPRIPMAMALCLCMVRGRMPMRLSCEHWLRHSPGRERSCCAAICLIGRRALSGLQVLGMRPATGAGFRTWSRFCGSRFGAGFISAGIPTGGGSPACCVRKILT